MWMDMLLTVLQWEAVAWILIALSLPLSWILETWCYETFVYYRAKAPVEADARERWWHTWAARFSTWGEKTGTAVFWISTAVFWVTAMIFVALCIFFPPHWL